ncbi:MAG: DNA-binding transcriptional regulator [Mogibacterium sp.]|nr:DNA-binding transcriptional regulator [Mogibacterium sp.]
MGRKENKYMDNFFKAVLSLETEEECRAFFDDVATIKELQDLTYRLEVARLLANGKVFSEISKETGTSSATIGRVNKCLNYGPGGYALVLERIGALPKETEKEQ